MAVATAAMAGAAALSAGSSLISANNQRRTAKAASAAQQAAMQQAIDEQRAQQAATMDMLKPWLDAGGTALQAQMGLTGLLGAEKQQEQIGLLENSPLYQQLAAQGENAMLQNASATGGLRGGNTQAALAQFRPQMLNSLIGQQLQQYGNLSANGLNTANSLANFGQAAAGNIGNLMTGQGAAQAGEHMARGAANQSAIGGVTNAIGGLMNAFGGGFGGSGFNASAVPNMGAGLNIAMPQLSGITLPSTGF